MRRLNRRLVAVAAFAILFGAPGCKKKRRPMSEDVPGEALSTLQMADPRIEPQLVKGVYGVEQGAWRWTAGAWTVKLKVPATGAQKGATLNFKFTIPDVVLTKVGPSITMSSSVNGTPLSPETYSKAGEQIYTRDVPAAALAR